MNYPLFLRTELLIKYVRLMDKILNLDSVDLYNKLYGLETLTMPKFTSQILLLFSKVLHILENLLLKNFTGLKVVS